MTGAPKKYRHLIWKLDEDKYYSPARIARLSGLDKQHQQRIRITLARYATKHHFPHEGDGIVTLSGQGPTPGWSGKRWKQTYGEMGWR